MKNRLNLVPLALLALAPGLALAQVPFPPQNANGPVGYYRQDIYPYPGQCQTSGTFGSLPTCTPTNAPSFACAAPGISNQSAASSACGTITNAPVKVLKDAMTSYAQSKFRFNLLNPLDYTPDTLKYTNADYYEIGIHEAWGFQEIATAGTVTGIPLFPDPTNFICDPVNNTKCAKVPNGKQWTGLFNATGSAPVYTSIFGIGQINMGGGPVTTTLTTPPYNIFTAGPIAPWSPNNYIATWPSISIRAHTGRPVVVKWVNEQPNNHLFCPHPEAADWPCAIDRTFMGMKATIDPATQPSAAIPYDRVNQFGSPQQPDNSWVTHLHGGEIPPETDGFAEKWYGNTVTAAAYNDVAKGPQVVNPVFGAPFNASTQARAIPLITRPTGNADTYAYPMSNQESTIWFHTHTLGKTHHDVISGPAGFFPVKDDSKHVKQVAGACSSANPVDCEYTWLDPVTEPRGALGIPKYDLFLAVQDRSFTDDGELNFPNGISIAPPPGLAGATPWTPGVNPQVHPQWVPEYFADHALVNGVLWPKAAVAPGFYRIRVVDGSDARCYTVGFSTQEAASGTAAAAAPAPVLNVRFTIIADEQGYFQKPLLNQTSFTMCPGERYELLIDFGQTTVAKTGVPACKLGSAACANVYMTNSANAPFPNGGNAPQAIGTIYPALANIMRFDVTAIGTPPPVLACPKTLTPGLGGPNGTDWPAALGCMFIPATIDQDFVAINNYPDCPKNATTGVPDLTFNGGQCVAAERQLYLNERVDGMTWASMGLQLNGVPFEYQVTETPKKGTFERWRIINLTVDAHPIHPHLVKAQITGRANLNKGLYLTALCGSTTCEPGMAPGGVAQVTPDVNGCFVAGNVALAVPPSIVPALNGTCATGKPFITGAVTPPAAYEAGWKDAMVAYPSKVTTFVAKWDALYKTQAGKVSAPGAGNNATPESDAKLWTYSDVTAGPYVWHCHINSHEDSEMMRTSLVLP